MTNILRAAVPLATMLVVPFTGLAAKEPAPHITVVAPAEPEVQAWLDRVGQAIDRKMRYPRTISTASYDEGVVELTFAASEDGTPIKVAVLRSSGSRQLDRAAVAAVKRVRSLHPLPSGVDHEQVYKARLLFVIDDGSDRWKTRVAAMHDKDDRSNAALARQPSGPATVAVVAVAPAGTL